MWLNFFNCFVRSETEVGFRDKCQLRSVVFFCSTSFEWEIWHTANLFYVHSSLLTWAQAVFLFIFFIWMKKDQPLKTWKKRMRISLQLTTGCYQQVPVWHFWKLYSNKENTAKARSVYNYLLKLLFIFIVCLWDKYVWTFFLWNKYIWTFSFVVLTELLQVIPKHHLYL